MKHDDFYQAMLARDYRFDGKFFVGVKTTGIYCRPICPAKPKRENIEFYLSASAAEKAGYRPCLRCRPECAPSSPAWFGTSAVVQRALRAIASDGFFDADEDSFAAQFGVTARHLRRLFIDEVGLTPKQIAFNNRLNFARKLIVESDLPITSVALTAGFASLRRFNDAFKKRFKRSPSALRKKRERPEADGIEITLSYRPPFDWESLLDFFRSHHIAGSETITDETYERVFRFASSVGFLRVTHQSDESCLKLRVFVDDPTHLFTVAQRVRRMFDLDSDPLLVANCFRGNRFMNSLSKRYPGLRLARGWDPFESAISTILGQLVSLRQARELVRQVVENYGEKISHPISGDTSYLFPAPEKLVASDLKAVKTTQVRREAIREFCQRVVEKDIDLHLPVDDESLIKRLLSIRGIGIWTAQYIALRATGSTDAFPETDLILKRALGQHEDIELAQLRPWRSYAAVYLWKHYARELSKAKRKTK